MRPARHLGWSLGLVGAAAFIGLGWGNLLGGWWAKATIIVLCSASITLLGASSNGIRDRLLFGLLGAVVAWAGLVLAAAAMTLAKIGGFEEGGPVGLALVFGVYLGLPIAVSTAGFTLLTWRAFGPSRPGERA